jgi:hypothetical protein
LTQFAAGLSIALLTFGCQAPWTTAPSFTRIGASDHGAVNHDKPLKGADSSVNRSTADGLVAEPRALNMPESKTGNNDQAMTDVMQEVERAGASDPAAQKMLIDELQRSKPELWPLVVQQFKSTTSYHQQLVAKSSTVAARDASEDARSRVTANNAPNANASTAGSPSARIGELADPRGTGSDSATYQTVAVATPGNMPAPLDAAALASAVNAPKTPQTPAADPAARPISAPNSVKAIATASVQPASAVAPAVNAPHQAQQAIYEAAADSSSGVQQALATTPAIKTKDSRLSADSTTDPGSHDWRQDVDQAIKDLQQRLPDAPQTTAEVHQQVSLRLLELLAGRTEDALKPIPNISHEEQDYWSGQIYALATYLDHHSQPDDKRRAAASVAHLEEAVSHLRELGSLALRNLTFCKHVYDFGAYEPYDEAQFAAGQQVTLYVEVENYHSDSTDKGYCTSLGTSYEVFDEQGKRIEGGDFPDVEDCCRSHRRDFHIQYGMAIPKKLGPGKYRLDLVMKDRRGDKLGHASIDFEVRGAKS